MDISMQEQQFFQDFSDLLSKHAAMDGKFSLWRVHQHHEIAEDEVLHEVSDSIMRTSTINIIKKETLPEAAFASSWLIKSDGSVKPIVWCCD